MISNACKQFILCIHLYLFLAGHLKVWNSDVCSTELDNPSHPDIITLHDLRFWSCVPIRFDSDNQYKLKLEWSVPLNREAHVYIVAKNLQCGSKAMNLVISDGCLMSAGFCTTFSMCTLQSGQKRGKQNHCLYRCPCSRGHVIYRSVCHLVLNSKGTD